MPMKNRRLLPLMRIMLLCAFLPTPLLQAEDARFHYINAYGERLNQSDYFYASDFSCGFGIAQATNGEWIVVDTAGNEKGTGVIGGFWRFREPRFSEGVALLPVDIDEGNGHEWTYAIGTDASIRFILKSKPVWPFCHGIALTSTADEKKVVPIDYTGQVLHSNQYDIAALFPDSTLGVGLRRGEKREAEETFLFDGAGRETRIGQGGQIGDIVGSFYAEYGEFRGGSEDRRIRIHSSDGRVLFERDAVTRVCLDSRGEGLFGFIHYGETAKRVFFVDLAGRDVLSGTDTNRLKAVCSEGMIRCRNKPSGLYGFVDRTGRMRVPPQFLDAGDFSEGLAWVVDKNRNLGYIDTKGKMRIATGCKVRLPWYDGRDFHNGIAVILAK